LQEVQNKTSSTEFLEWMVYLNKEIGKTTKQDYLFASIAREIRMGNVKDAKKVTFEDVLVKMEAVTPKEDEEEEEEEEELTLQSSKVQEKMAISKSFWGNYPSIKKEA